VVLESGVKRSNPFNYKLESSSKKQKFSVQTSIPSNLSLPNQSSTSSSTSASHRISYQEVQGTISHSSVADHVLVISEGWPSWSFALDGLGFSSITTSAYFSSLSSKEEFKSTSLGLSPINNNSIQGWIESKGDLGLIFIQGDQSFLYSMYHRLENFDALRLVFGCNDQTFWTADGWRESHSNCGGVTNGEWTFYCQNMVLSNDRLPCIERSLWHVLRTTEGQSSKYALSKALGHLHGPNDRLNWNDKFPQVRTRSVYHKDALIT
jgi:hypothetical protein